MKTRVSRMYRGVCWAMVVLFPAAMGAADTGGMLNGKGEIWLNHSLLQQSSAVFPGDLIETSPSSVANIVISGSNVIIQPDSAVRFENNALELEHGTVRIGTSRSMKVHAGCVETGPASSEWTEFEVTSLNEIVHIAAGKHSVIVKQGFATASGSGSSTHSKAVQLKNVTLAEGQQTDRNGHCERDGATPPACCDGKIIMEIGVAAAAGLGIWLAWPGDNNPVSPSKPCPNSQPCE